MIIDKTNIIEIFFISALTLSVIFIGYYYTHPSVTKAKQDTFESCIINYKHTGLQSNKLTEDIINNCTKSVQSIYN